jgi:hypothetical protein
VVVAPLFTETSWSFVFASAPARESWRTLVDSEVGGALRAAAVLSGKPSAGTDTVVLAWRRRRSKALRFSSTCSRGRRSPILLTERKDHLEFFASRLARIARNLVVLHGGKRAKADREAQNEERVLLATGRYIGEGLDDARLDTLFLALPRLVKGHARAVCRTAPSIAPGEA